METCKHLFVNDQEVSILLFLDNGLNGKVDKVGRIGIHVFQSFFSWIMA